MLLQDRIDTVKELYEDAREYLGVDDAVRISGYVNTLEDLAIDFVSVGDFGF